MRDMGDAGRVLEESWLHEGGWAAAATHPPTFRARVPAEPTAGCTAERGVRRVCRVPSELQSLHGAGTESAGGAAKHVVAQHVAARLHSPSGLLRPFQGLCEHVPSP